MGFLTTMSTKTKWILIGGLCATVVVTLAIALPLTLNESNNEESFFIGRMVLDDVPLIDGHNDLPYNLYMLEKNQINDFEFDANLKEHPIWGTRSSSYTDLPRLREGKVGGQFWVAYVGCRETQHKDAVEQTLDQIDVIKRLIAKYPNDLQYTTTADGIMEAFKNGKLASMIAVEGGHSMDSRLSVLRIFHEIGVRYMTLTHSCNQPWVDASPIDSNNEEKRNLTDWGVNVITEMNRLGIMVDLSHVSYGVMHAVLDTTRAPVIFSHSSSFNVTNHHRNVHDDVLERVVENDGIVMVNFYPGFIGGRTIMDVVKHLNHIKSVTGPNHIGIGADYDGVEEQPVGLEDVSKYPDLFDLLGQGGEDFDPWTKEELQKLAGLNLIRVFKAVEQVAVSMKNTPPVEDLIPDLDLYNSANQTCRSNFNFKPSADTFLEYISGESNDIDDFEDNKFELCM